MGLRNCWARTLCESPGRSELTPLAAPSWMAAVLGRRERSGFAPRVCLANRCAQLGWFPASGDAGSVGARAFDRALFRVQVRASRSAGVIIAFTSSATETKQLAAALAELARPGDVILLAGDLGAGKTAFAQGFGAALGIDESITSPTFTLVNQYTSGRLELFHLDVYRLDQVDEALDLGLAEMLDEGGVTLIEWGDTIIPALPADFLEVSMRIGEGDDDRMFEIQMIGPRWSARNRALGTALAPWIGQASELPSLMPRSGEG